MVSQGCEFVLFDLNSLENVLEIVAASDNLSLPAFFMAGFNV